MSEFREHPSKVEPEALGRVLRASPSRGAEQFFAGGCEVEQILEMSSAVTIHGGVKLEENLIQTSDETDGETWTVFPSDKASHQPRRQPATE
jgi:hypothetical protein